MPRLALLLLVSLSALACSKEPSPTAPSPVAPEALHPQAATASGGDKCPTAAFNIEFVFIDGVDYKYQLALQRAADRWENVVVGDKTDIDFLSQRYNEWNSHINAPIRVNKIVDDLIVFVNEKPLPEGTVASTSVILVAASDQRPVVAAIALDDLALQDEQPDHLDQIMLHEIGHCLGFGTTTAWDNLLKEWPTSSWRDQPHFTGLFAGVMFDIANNFALFDKKVPLDDDGGHWLQSVIGDEIMAKGWTYPFKQPISEMTVGAFLDLGYDVSFWGAQAYQTPAAAAAKAGEVREYHCVLQPRRERMVREDGRVVD